MPRKGLFTPKQLKQLVKKLEGAAKAANEYHWPFVRKKMVEAIAMLDAPKQKTRFTGVITCENCGAIYSTKRAALLHLIHLHGMSYRDASVLLDK